MEVKCCCGNRRASSWLRLLVLLIVACYGPVVHGFNETISPVFLTLERQNTVYVATDATEFPGSGLVDLSFLNFTIFPTDDAHDGNNHTDLSLFEIVHLDVVLVKSPDTCSGCSLLEMGIGVEDKDNSGAGDENGIVYCCSKLALQAKLCTQSHYGRLIWNPDVFDGQVRDVTVMLPVDEETTLTMRNPNYFSVPVPGVYALILANCDLENGPQNVEVTGYTVWISDQDELQQYFEQDVPFFAIMAAAYACLLGWYSYLMKENKDSRIPLEEWIRGIIVLGFLDCVFGVLEFTVLQHNDYNTAAHILIGLGSVITGIKHGLSRSLLLMLSLGWGVVYPTLNSLILMGIVTLGVAYCVLEGLEDFLYVIGKNDPTKPFVNFIYMASMIIDVLFLIWIPMALCKTMKYLKESNQLRKLERYRKLLYILGLAVLLTIGLFLLIFLDAVWDESKDLSLYNLSQGNDVNFFLIMLFVAILWKPNPMAREFAYAMELSSQEINGEDDIDDMNGGPLGMNGREGYLADLELTENNNHRNNGDYDIDAEADNDDSFNNRPHSVEIS